MRTRVVLAAFVLGLAAVGAGVAGLNHNWSVHVNATMQVPVNASKGQGQAMFKLSSDGAGIDYKLIGSNIENVFMAHIHQGAPGVNGPIVVWLYPSTAQAPGPAGSGRHDGVLSEGTIRASDLTGPLAGRPLSDLVALMNGGGAYVNIHTNDGIAPLNTGPGDLFPGEIRGDIH
jgi:hypothetical protein